MVERSAACFGDHRDPVRVEHSARGLAMQRVWVSLSQAFPLQQLLAGVLARLRGKPVTAN